MASPVQWRWTWANSGNWWWTGKPGMLQSMGSKRVDMTEWLTGNLSIFSEQDWLSGLVVTNSQGLGGDADVIQFLKLDVWIKVSLDQLLGSVKRLQSLIWDGRVHLFYLRRTFTAVFLPGEFHKQRSLVGYSPWGHEESDIDWWV